MRNKSHTHSIDMINLPNYQINNKIEDFGGESLEKLFNSPLTISKFLPLAIKITDILGEIHAANVIHKDINPSNIVLNPDTEQLKIIDFGISTKLPCENLSLKNPNQLEGTLPYISPEQTGRMNRVMDYRTDFYSLGVSFYELLTQSLPFESEDMMELVHNHLAKTPIPPHNLNPEIPKVISDIIMKLLAKNAEERYQSAYGLKVDLQNCQASLVQGEINPFPLAKQDFSNKFQLSQKLYGRQDEIDRLLASFERVASQKGSEMMLVSGYSGIGKTALVQEIYKPLTQKRGYFISGKFDQQQRNIPYAAIVNAFTNLVQQLLTETETQLQEWKEKILAAVGKNGQIIIEVISDVELIVGEQPEAPKLPPVESQNRFNLVFQNFIKVFTKPEHPLVIFLDDLQWVDSASLKLIQLLMQSTDIHTLFLIGAYRDNEVSAAHPLKLTLEKIEKTEAIVNKILLKPLELKHVKQLITDTLHTKENAQALAKLLHSKTGGNPFFINEFLNSLYNDKLLTLDTKQGCWQCQLEKIQQRDFTDNVVELMVDNLKKLPENTQEALKFAACIGNQFDIDTLAKILEKTPQETTSNLQEAIGNGQLSVINKKLLKDINATMPSLISECQFAHDRIQEAAYSLIYDEQKPVLHWQIGQLLLQNNTPLEEHESKIFTIVDHLNKGRKLIDKQSKRDELAKLNLTAGKKAKASAAYQSAFNYLKIGLKLLSDDCWQTQYDLTLAVYEEAAEAAYLTGNFKLMEQWIELVLQQAKTVLDKVKGYKVKIHADHAQGKPTEALNTGLQALELLGIKFPNRRIFIKLQIKRDLLLIKLAMLGKNPQDLIKLPKMTAPNQKAAMQILANIWAYAYMTDIDKLKLTLFAGIKLLIKHGNVPESAVGYALYAVMCVYLGDIETGYKFGELALEVLDKFNVIEYKAKTKFIVYALMKHWKHPLKKSIDSLDYTTYQNGLDTGDLEFAGYIPTHKNFFSVFNQNISDIEKDIRKFSKSIAQLKQERIINKVNIFHQSLLNLMNDSKISCLLIGEVYNEQTMLPVHLKANDKSALFWLHYHKLYLCYLLGYYSEALKNAKNFIKHQYLDAMIGYIHFALFYFYDSLIQLALYKDATVQEQHQYRKKIKANQKKIKKWAHHAPMNYEHKFYLVEAELHRVLGKNWKAMKLYDKAIKLARENEYLNEEALAYELAAKFYKNIKKDKIAQVYFKDAHYAYTKWGAIAKVKRLEKDYPQFFENMKSATSNTDLNLKRIINPLQEIADEIDLEALLKKIINIVLKNSGAQRCFLILEKNGQWFIEAEGAIDKDEVTVLQSIPIAESSISKNIIDHVIRTNDLYIVEHQVKSVLCMPLLTQNKLIGLLYLDNKMAHIFTQDKLTALKLLSSQIAMSIRNACNKEKKDINIKYQKEIEELKKGLLD